MIYPKHIPDNTPLTLSASVGPVTVSEQLIWGNTAQTTIQALGGRMAILDVEAPGSVEQIDGKYALNLASVTDAETRRFTAPDGQQVTLEISAPKQVSGWGEGIHYMLERDATETLIFEPGRNHRKVYVTAGAHGYTKAKIAEEVGGGLTATQITNAWLTAQTTYGGSAAKALAFDEGLRFFHSISGNKVGPQSNWLLLEKGYSYDNTTMTDIHFIPQQANGESFLHPVVITSYGSGHPPVIKGKGLVTFGPKKIVIHDISNGVHATQRSGSHILRSDIIHEPGDNGFDVSQVASDTTFYRCSITDIHNPVPYAGVTGDWSNTNYDRIFGMYVNDCNHVLLEDCFSDLNGWRPGYAINATYAQNPNQPPSIYSHDYYLSFDNRDVTLIGGIISRAAAHGYQMRSGGRVQDNVLIDNNAMGTEAGGGSVTSGISQPRKGNYTLVYGNVCTSAGYKPYQGVKGAINWGIDVQSGDVVALDNIVCHRANPDDPAEIAAKPNANRALFIQPYNGAPSTTFDFDNTVHRKWEATDKNIEGLNLTALDTTTIQRFAATKLPNGTAPTIANLMDWMRLRTPRERQLIQREMLTYFRTPYDPKLELSVVKRTVAATVTFRPDRRCEGFLWDQRMNWTTGDLPGTVAADTVDLFGNFVRFDRLTQTVASIKFDGGTLDVVSGKLTAQAHADAANVRVRLAGQYFAPANAHGDYIAEGGRLVFGGAATVDLEVAGDAECDLGPNLTIKADGELTLNGGDIWVGWNGTGTRTATGPLAFVEVDGKVGKLQRFKRRGDDPEPTVTATYVLTALRIDVTTPGTYDLGGGAGTGVTYTNPNNITLPAGVTLTGGKLTLVV